jgi:hypothetical protein
MPRTRKINSRQYKKRLFIVCEGKKTEPNYFKQLIAQYNFRGKPVYVRVIDTIKNTPKELVDEAKKLIEIDEDEAWAVFDKNGYTKHHEVFGKAKAGKKKINIAFSSISFEFWLLLHFEYTTRPFYRAEELITYLKQKGYFSEYNKADKDIFSPVRDKVPTAIKNAKKVRTFQIDANNFDTKAYQMNPYTNVDELLEAIDNISKAYQ